MLKLLFPNEHQEKQMRFALILTFVLFVCLVVSYVLEFRIKPNNSSEPSRTVYHTFPPVEVQAKAAYIYDARTKQVLFAKNENLRLPLASITKLMSALVASELSPEYGTVTVTKEALATEGDSGLKSNEHWNTKDLLDFSLVSSSNDGIKAVALALGALKSSAATETQIETDFVQKMNTKANQLDLKNTYYRNPTGLDETEVKGGAYGSAKDMATLMENIITYHPDLLEATQEKEERVSSLNNLEHIATNTNAIVGEIPGILASKTGYTDIAGGNLVFAFDPEIGRPIIIAILGSTAEGRFDDAKKLINATLQYIHE